MVGFGLKKRQTVGLGGAKTILIFMAVAMMFAGLPHVAAKQQVAGAPADAVEFVQITTMLLDAGKETYEAFRILSTGRLERARWTSYGYLLDHSEFHGGDRELFERVRTARSVLQPSKRHRQEGALGRMVFWFEIATLAKSGTQSTLVNEVPDNVVTLIDDLRRIATPTSIQPGWYVWTRLYSLGGLDTPGIDLRRVECDSAVTMALVEALATGQLIVRADDAIQAFISG